MEKETNKGGGNSRGGRGLKREKGTQEGEGN